MPVEQTRTDFPFYKGQPVTLRLPQWAFVMLGLTAGLAALYLPLIFSSGIARILSIALFVTLPLLALRAVAGQHWRALFQRVRLKDILLAVAIALLNIGVTMVVGWLVSVVFGTNANPAMQTIANASGGERAWFLLQTLPQLLGEELLTILPFLALLTWFRQSLACSRRTAMIGAWLISSLIFGMVHLPTYQWNWAQCLLIIGSARLVLSLAYLATKNTWVSTMAHVFNDWLLFGLAIVLKGLAMAPLP